MSRQGPVSRTTATVAWLAALSITLFAACGGGESPEEASAQCQREAEQLLTCPETAFDECVACREDCGDGCRFIEPCGYSCD